MFVSFLQTLNRYFGDQTMLRRNSFLFYLHSWWCGMNEKKFFEKDDLVIFSEKISRFNSFVKVFDMAKVIS